MQTDFDVIVIGGGSAGLTAAIYTSRAGKSTMILEKESMGGELVNREMIENYPGFGEGVEGPVLAAGMAEQAMNTGAQFEYAEVTSVEDKGDYKVVHCEGKDYTCRGIVIASGSLPRKLGIPGEEQYEGNGVFYCATCDGPKYTGKRVVVAGAGDSGITEALALSEIASAVTVLEFMDKPKASKVLLDRAENNPKVSLRCGVQFDAVTGSDHMEGVDITDKASGAKEHVEAEGLLVRIGLIPNTQYLKDVLELTPIGQVPVNEYMETKVPGIVACGDLRQFSPMQISTAVGDGAAAAMALNRYLDAH